MNDQPRGPLEDDQLDGDPIDTTVIICVYNRPRQIRECIAALRELDGSGFEILVVDDGSTDETPAVLQEIASGTDTPPVRLARCPENRGVSGARNVGIDYARGRFVLFTDSDCIADRHWLLGMREPLLAGRADAVAGLVLDPPPSNLAERTSRGWTKVGGHRLQRRPLVGCNMGFTRAVVAKQRFDETLRYYCDEDELATRLEAVGARFEFVGEAIVHHRHPLSMRDYMRQAWKHGRGAARFWYKHGSYIGRDVAGLFAAMISLPLTFLPGPVRFVPVLFLLLHLLAVLFSEIAFKGKPLSQALIVLGPALAYSTVKAVSVAWTLFRIVVLRAEPAVLESRRSWRREMAAARGDND